MKKLLASAMFGSISMLLAGQALAENTDAFAILGSTPFAHKNYGTNVVKGRAELHASGHSSTMVIVWLAGLKPGSIHASHIHRGARVAAGVQFCTTFNDVGTVILVGERR